MLIRCQGKRKGCAEPKSSGAGTASFDPAVISGFSSIDVALCRCQSFHSVDWCIRRNRNARQNLGHAALIKAAYDALPENGALIVVENIIDDERRENAFGFLMSLNMLIEFGDAFDLARRLLELVQRSRIQKLRSSPPRRPMQRRHHV